MNKIREVIIKALDDKKGENIVEIDLSGLDGAISDAFIVCSATSNTHAEALSMEVDRQMLEELKEKPLRVEGKENGLWIIMDYGDVLVHIFERETRNFYDIEGLWGADRVVEHFQE